MEYLKENINELETNSNKKYQKLIQRHKWI